ncbi:MAG: 3-phosphoshikimate 1-carboxyvinyltransferase, partial [Clostridia bacterium]|nr:3-phosphoshikimate 1-carboxyvinyltransferase [Clostridia bacterium]
MRVTVEAGRAAGAVTAPPSKSMAHRLLICAGLCEGRSVIHGISRSEDMSATLDCLQALGVEYVRDGDTVTVVGTDLRACSGAFPLPCRESGSTLRFFLPLALLTGKRMTLCGSETLMQRPMGVFEALCREHGLYYRQDGRRIAVRGPLRAGEYAVVGNVSSQFISGLLFALPLVEGDSVIRITPPVESRSYINLTVDALREFGVEVTWQDEHTLGIRGGQTYRAHETTVEGDYSNAAFLEALNLFGGEVSVDGLRPDSLQGDRVYKRYFEMLCKGTPTIHIGDCPDLGPVLFSVSAAKNGGIFNGTRRLRIKESDRAAAMAEELKRFGTSVTVYEDTVVVYPTEFHAPREPLQGHNYHRIVMALSVLLSLTGGVME